MQELKALLGRYLPAATAECLSTVLNKGIPIQITGRQGATGKTTLCAALKELGYNASEPWELEGKENEGNSNEAHVTITLNALIN